MKDYKRILQGVVNIINITKKSDIGFSNICAYIGENCPELKESEDERIRQRIIHALHGDVLEMSEIKEAIACLEKQGEQILANIAKTCKVEQKPEWSEDDKRKIDRIYSVLRQAADTHAFSTSCRLIGDKECVELQDFLKSLRPQNTLKPSDEHYELEEFAKIVRCNLTGISKAVQKLFEAKYLQLTGNKMYEGFKD